jgi:penicillin amidase
MGHAMMKKSLFWVLTLALCGACGDDDGTDDTMDASMEEDMAPPTGDDGGVGPMDLPGLDGEVEVIVDDRGMPHIYATTVHDLMLVQGYLMSQDRFIQMEFIRRGVTGRLAEVLGGLEPTLVDDDRSSRFLGFKRQGEAIYESLADDSRSKLAADAFVDGINLYIEEVVEADGYRSPPDLEVFNLMREAGIGRWTGADVFALARYQSWNLSYDAGADTARTEALLGVQEAFAPDSGGDEILESRAGIYGDFFSEVQARRVYTRDGLPASDPFTAPLIFERELPALTPQALRGARTFFDRLDENPLFHRDEHVGSNSWVVSGDVTESGNPILSNDPHLSLTSPGIWWYVHLNTAEMEGEDDIDVQGVAFAGLPGVVLGYNRDLAWSATTTGYDVTDVYSEVVTYRFEGADADPPWVPVSVSFEGSDVDVEVIDEEIAISDTDPTVYRIYDVPHHGPIIPGSEVYPDVTDPSVGDTAEGGALSVRYTGHEVTNELAFFVELMTATSVDEAAAAHREHFQVGAQNIAMVDRSGNIAWSSHAWIPQREAAACTFAIDADGVVDGVSPLFVLPGQGGYEWLDDIDDAAIPQAKNPAEGFIATANQDNAGVTDDGNVCNESVYIGGGFAVGYRMGRIVENLETMTEAGDITPAMMIELQAETKSSLGETMRDPIVAALDHALGDPSDDPALDALVTEAGGTDDLQDVRDRLAAWSLETPHGVGATDTGEIADSVATTIFNAIVTRLTGLAFDDEEAAIGRGMNSSYNARMLEWSLADSATQATALYTYAETYQGDADWNDTVVWDDITTDSVLETRDERVTRAVLNALAWLTEELGDDWDEWRWGRLHAVRFGQIVPSLSGQNRVSIPPGRSEEFPLGFPRHGDYGAVDVGNYSMTNGERFTHGSGASQRLVVEMTAEGPVMPFNALPGGQSEDIRNPHHADEAELWRMNQQPPLYYTRDDVEANGEVTYTVSPR